jgi:hypothetical protein
VLDLSTVVGRGTPDADALADVEAAENFWGSLPRHDPVEMQRRLCNELAKGASWDKLDINRFRALRVLDRRAGRLLEGIVAEYAVLGGQSPALERPLWQAALEMTRSFAHDFDRFLRAIHTGAAGSAWQERMPELLVRLFRHREIELLLAMFRYIKWPRGRWKSLHDAFRFATANGLATRAVPTGKRADGSLITVTPEHVYVRILLLQLLDGGQFRPEEIAWARRAIVDWSKGLGLRELPAVPHDDESRNGFIVDLAGTKGLTHINGTVAGDLLWLDTGPIADSINAAIAERGDIAAKTATSGLQAGQRSLLGKLQLLYAPQSKRIKRRGERTAVTLMSVEAMVGGLQGVFRVLGEEAQRAISVATVPMPYADQITITDVDRARAARGPAPADSPAGSVGAGYDVLSSTWHVRDRSDSGCRLRGRVPDARRLLPGLLVALRNDKLSPWTVAVVRRLNRLTGNNVEIGVEHIGRNPQRIILLSDPAGLESGVPSETRSDRFVALYLPESDACPRIPIKTLLMPACEFVPGRVVTMLSTMQEVVIRLRKPLEHQAEFVWASFEPLDGASSADSASYAVQ